MKVAILSESPADEAAIRILVDALLGRALEPPAMPPLRSRGYPAVVRQLPTVLRHLYYRTDAEALVVVIDSDDSLVHDPSHEQAAAASPDCRLCEAQRILGRVQTELASKRVRPVVKTAVGLAVPSIEAWYLAGRDPHVCEAAWIQGQQSGRPPYDRLVLKKKVYGTDRPALSLEIERAKAEAERIVRNGALSHMEQLFPGGFGPLAREIRAW